MQLFNIIHSSLQEYCNTFSHTFVERCPGQRTHTLIMFVHHILYGRYQFCVATSARMSAYSRGHGAANITTSSIMTYTCTCPLRPTGPRWAPCWPHELWYPGMLSSSFSQTMRFWERRCPLAREVTWTVDLEYTCHKMKPSTANYLKIKSDISP